MCMFSHDCVCPSPVYQKTYTVITIKSIKRSMSIAIQQITYIHSDKEILFKDLTFTIAKGQKIALIGNNGSGKSTLLQIIAGQLTPSSGTIVRPADAYYIPQHFGQYDGQTLAQALRIARKVDALHAILAGEASVENFNALDNDWNIEERAQAALCSWGLYDKPLSHPMSQLSGGEKTRAFLAGMELHAPSVVLLDEPTNHLDTPGRNRLYAFIRRTTSTLIIVSHDRTLLNLLTSTYELNHSSITCYGGNYEFYKEQKAIMQQGLQQQLDEKEKALRLARKTAREVAERKEKQNVRGEKASARKGISRMGMDTLKDRAEKSTTKLSDIHAEKAGKLAEEATQLRISLAATAMLKTDFNASSLRQGKTLLRAHDINFGYRPEAPLWDSPLRFQLKSGDRICIEGANGSGKSTLLKLITGELLPTAGELTRSDFKYVYLNQEYSIIRNERSILEQAEAFNSRNLAEHEVKIILNRYLFPATVWDKSCSKLSGGEKMRLAFCCLMISDNTPDVFLLDEPTNNLDIQSIDIITRTIRSYTGTVLVVSHDSYFKEEIGVTESIKLQNFATPPILSTAQ